MKRYINAFAKTGDKLAIPDTVPSNGKVSYEKGYGADYSKDPSVDVTADRIERDNFNQLIHDITENLQLW